MSQSLSVKRHYGLLLHVFSQGRYADSVDPYLVRVMYVECNLFPLGLQKIVAEISRLHRDPENNMDSTIEPDICYDDWKELLAMLKSHTHTGQGRSEVIHVAQVILLD